MEQLQNHHALELEEQRHHFADMQRQDAEANAEAEAEANANAEAENCEYTDAEVFMREELAELRGELRDKFEIMADQLKAVTEKLEFTQSTLVRLLEERPSSLRDVMAAPATSVVPGTPAKAEAPAIPGTWTPTAPPPKAAAAPAAPAAEAAEAQTAKAVTHSIPSPTFGDRPAWSTAPATSWEQTEQAPKSNVVRRTSCLLPTPIVGWERQEDDSIPASFLDVSPAALEQASLAALLTGGRPAARIAWKFAAPMLQGTTTQWSTWITEVMREVRAHSPPQHSASSMQWAVQAFKLELTPQQLWHVEPTLQSFDDSLALHLAGLLRAYEGTPGREFARRLNRMDDQSIAIGRTVPARKLLSMLGQHSLKDPTYSEQLWESKFNSMAAPGVGLQDMLEFSDHWYELLGEAPESLWSDAQVQRKYMSEIRRCTHPQVKKDFASFNSLHPQDRSKNWEFWPPLLRRLADADLHRSQVNADIRASLPPVVKPKGSGPPAAPVVPTDGDPPVLSKRAAAAARKAERSASEKPPSKPPAKTTGDSKTTPAEETKPKDPIAACPLYTSDSPDGAATVVLVPHLTT